NRSHELDRQLTDSDVGADELERPHRQETGEAVGDGNAAAKRQPRRRPHECLLRDSDVHEALLESLGQTANGRPILGGQDDEPLVAESEIEKSVLVALAGHRTICASDSICAATPSWSSTTSASTSSGVKLQNHRSTRPSGEGSPFPLTVRATIAWGRPEFAGRSRNAASSSMKSCPSTLRTLAPKARSFSSRGSRGTRSSVAALA